MKTRIDRNIVVWVCATLCVFVVGCDMNLPDWWPGVEERDTTGATDGTRDDTTDGADGTDDVDDVDDGDTDDGDADADDQVTGQLKVLITDKPYPFEFIAEALVTITRVEVHMITNYAGDVGTNSLRVGDGDGEGEGANTNGLYDNDTDGGHLANSNGESEDTPWITVFEGSESFDLVQLRDGETDLLAEADIEPGRYNQMRLIVTEGQITLVPDAIDTNGVDNSSTNGLAYGGGNWMGDSDTHEVDDVDTNGRVFPLRVPSGAQSGIKLHLAFDVLTGEETTLLLDVDLSRAFKPVPGGEIKGPGEIREFLFKPSLGMRLTDVSKAGSISGVVTEIGTNGLLSPLPGVSVTAYSAVGYGQDEIEVTTTASNDDGAYTVSGLAAGEYRLEFWAADYEEAELTGIAVTAGQATEGVDVTLTKLPEP
ncbi:MAG: DUF4382 domain-containing protein [Phycisphaerales bacterium]|nr:MAG: DUF4382 domain-containing protein [Phycisphaerales bacterium]